LSSRISSARVQRQIPNSPQKHFSSEIKRHVTKSQEQQFNNIQNENGSLKPLKSNRIESRRASVDQTSSNLRQITAKLNINNGSERKLQSEQMKEKLQNTEPKDDEKKIVLSENRECLRKDSGEKK